MLNDARGINMNGGDSNYTEILLPLVVSWSEVYGYMATFRNAVC